MKRRKTILCAVLVLLAVSLAGLAWWQRENLKAVKDAAQHTSEELEEKLAENQQIIQEAVNAAPEIAVREVTEEEREALRDGSMSHEELVERLLDTAAQETPVKEDVPPVSGEAPAPAVPQESGGLPSTTSQPPAAPQSPAQETAPPAPAEPPKPVENTYQKELSALIARVYVLREEYTLALDNMYAAAKAEYVALPVEKRTKTNLVKMASGYLSRASALERECDSKMDEVVSAMEKLIRENNGSTSLVDTVVYTYANEKSLKKSWYMSKLEQKGLI